MLPQHKDEERLVGREPELRLLDEVLVARGTALLIEGAAGTGKSALLRVARDRALAAGHTVLRANCAAPERDFPFGVVLQLFERLVGRADTWPFDGPSSACEPVFRHRPAVTFSVLHGLYWLAVELTAAGRLVIVVDDVQHADEASLRWLDHLVRRMEGLPITLVAAATPGAVPGDLCHAAASLGALRPAAAAALGRAVLGDGDEEFWSACHTASAGNPLLLNGVLRGCRRAGVVPSAAQAHRLAEVVPPEARAMATRAATGEIARRLMTAVAVLGGEDPGLLAEITGLELPAVCEAGRELAERGLFTESFGFAHPVVRAAVLQSVPTGARWDLHLAAAQALRLRQEPARRIAEHLVSTSPGETPWARHVLSTAAAAAAQEGEHDVAVRFLRRAVREPAADGERARLLVALGRAELGSDLEAAVHHLLQGSAGCGDGAIALDLARAWSVAGHVPAAVGVLRRRCNEVPEELGRLLAANSAYLSSTAAGAAPPDGDAPALRAFGSMLAGRSAQETARLAVQAFLDGRWTAAHEGAVLALSAAGEPDAARARCDVVVIAARDALAEATGMVVRAEAHARLGHVSRSRDDARAGLAVLTRIGAVPDSGHVHLASACLAGALVDAGDLEGARAVLAGVRESDHLYFAWTLFSRARLHLARGDERRALADLHACGRRLGDSVALPWRSESALVTGNSELAEEELRRAERWGSRCAVGVAQRALGLLRDGEAGLELLRRAVVSLGVSPANLDHARALASLGERLLAHGESGEAQEHLVTAFDLADECGAVAVREEVRVVLSRLDVRPGRDLLAWTSALTPSEHRVAAMAAAGKTNRAIARLLFVGVRTVEMHLTSTYRKLRVNGRSELTRFFAPVPELSAAEPA